MVVEQAPVPSVSTRTMPPPRPRPGGEPLSPQRAARRQELVRALTDPIILPEDAETMQTWSVGTWQAFKPRNSWEDWLSQQAAVMVMRINRAQRMERKLRDLTSLRAIDCWEVDQELNATLTAAQLARDPQRVVADLWTTLAGCNWMLAHWVELAAVPADTWSEDQQALATALHGGEPADLRLPGFAARWVARIEDQRTRMVDADKALRALVEADLCDEPSPALTRLRRYERTLQRQLRWYITQLRINPPEHWEHHKFYPQFATLPVEPSLPDLVPLATQTKPTEPAPHATLTPDDETNPAEEPTLDSTTVPDETNPFQEDDSALPTSRVMAETHAAQELTIDPIAERAARVEARRQRVDPACELAKRRKAARRRSA